MPAKLSLEECIEIARLNGGLCLSKKYYNNYTKMLWECENGHQWENSFMHVKNGKQWCPYCAGLKLENGLLLAQQVAENKGGKCLSKKYTNNREKLLWQCDNGHKWYADLNHVKDGNKWCPYCAGNIKYNIEYCRKFARDKGGRCLSEEYINGREKLLWECENLHTWSARFNKIKNAGQWCPECCASRAQNSITHIIREIFYNYSILSNFKGFDWLKTQKGRQELDIYVPELKLAIEYDGEGHFMPVRWNGISIEKAERAFDNVKRLDRRKNRKISQNPQDVKYFIRFNYKENLTEDYIKEKLIKSGVKI